MWLYFDRGLVSIVEHKPDGREDREETLQVRSRSAEHLRAFLDVAGSSAEIIRTDHADYLFRAFLPRETVRDAVKRIVERLDYSNFKDAARERLDDWQWDGALHSAHAAAANYQRGRRLDRKPRR